MNIASAVAASAPVQCRPARADDEPFLRELFVALRRPQFALLGLPENPLQELLAQQFRAQQIGYRSSYPDSVHQILRVEDQAVGRLWVNYASTEIHLIDIALLPAWQSRGIGGALLRELMAQATASRPLRLNVDVANPRAQKFYQSLGLRVFATNAVQLQMQWPATPATAPRSTPVADD